MRRFASKYLVPIVLIAALGCIDEEPSDGNWPYDSGSVGQSQTCPTCGVDAGQGPVVTLGDAAVACTTLDPGACTSRPGCAPIVGLAYDPVRYCRGENQLPVYCQSAAVECGFGQVRVVDPVGQRWLLPNTCIPPGYKPAPTEIHPIEWIADYTVCPSAGLQTRCGQLDERGCAANPTCFAQMGTPLNERGSCKDGAERFVACVQNTTCNRVLTYARDPLGNTWELISSCLPSGYAALAQSRIASLTNWPQCGF